MFWILEYLLQLTQLNIHFGKVLIAIEIFKNISANLHRKQQSLFFFKYQIKFYYICYVYTNLNRRKFGIKVYWRNKSKQFTNNFQHKGFYCPHIKPSGELFSHIFILNTLLYYMKVILESQESTMNQNSME